MARAEWSPTGRPSRRNQPQQARARGLFLSRAVRRIALRRDSVQPWAFRVLIAVTAIDDRGALGTIMSPSHLRHPALALLLLLSACSFANDTLWPSLSGEDPRGVPAATPAATTVDDVP